MQFRRESRVKRPIYSSDKPSRVDASKADETDINYIVNKFLKTGQITHLAPRQKVFADFALMPKDLSESYALIQDAETAFASLPSTTREKFFNDPNLMIKFLQDTNNRDEAIKLGLIPIPESVAPSKQPDTQNSKNGKSKDPGKTTTNDE